MPVETKTLLKCLDVATIKAVELCCGANQSPPYDLASILSPDTVMEIPEFQAAIEVGIPPNALLHTLNTRLGGVHKHHHP